MVKYSLFAVLSLFTFISQSHAQVQRPQLPTPYLCSKIENTFVRPAIVAVQNICFARMKRTNTEALLVHLTDGTTQAWQITSTTPIPPTRITNGASIRSTLNLTYLGEIRAGGWTNRPQDPAQATLVKTSSRVGDRVTSVRGQLPGNLDVDVRGFQPVSPAR